MNLVISLILIFISFSSLANQSKALTVEHQVTNNLHLSFSNDKNIQPKIGDFEIVNYVLMSNEVGERYAVVTLTNLSSGTRNLEHQHMLALFADGSRRAPSELNLTFKGGESQSLTIYFGKFKFPILSIYTSKS